MHKLRPSRPFPRLLLIACLLLGSLAPTSALAHVKWFAEPEEHPLRLDLIFSDRTLLVVLVAGLAVLGGLMVSTCADPPSPAALQNAVVRTVPTTILSLVSTVSSALPA